MSDISARLVQVIENLGVKQSEFSDKTTIGRSTLNSTIKRGAELKSDAIYLIKKAYPNLSLDWFLTGDGDMWVEEIADKDKTKEELLLKIKDQEDKIKVLNYTLGTKENMIANRGKRIEQLEEYVATLQFRIQQLEEDQ